MNWRKASCRRVPVKGRRAERDRVKEGERSDSRKKLTLREENEMNAVEESCCIEREGVSCSFDLL